MASFSFGFQLGDGGGDGGEQQPEQQQPTSSATAALAEAAPPSFTAPMDTMAAAGAAGTAPPPPPCVVVPFERVPVSAAEAQAARVVVIDDDAGFAMRATQQTEGGMANVPEGVDLIPGVYEGGLKVWESSVDLVRLLHRLASSASASPPALALGPAQRVLELGCGHGLPGIYAWMRGARVCLTDLNPEVLAHVTRRNLALQQQQSPLFPFPDQAAAADRVLLVSGDWAAASRAMRAEWGGEEGEGEGEEGPFFDLILSAETFYTAEVTDKLLAAIARHLRRRRRQDPGTGEPEAQALVAGKRFYFGTHGSVADLVSRARARGFEAEVVESVADGHSNIRDVVRLTWGRSID